MRTLSLALFFLLLGCDLALAEPALVVITHPSRSSQLSADELTRIYLKKKRFWKDGKPIVPINREAGSAMRKIFERCIFDHPSPDLVAYWNRKYFHGVFPPATLESDDAVKRYVASDPNAVGYIAADNVDDSVRVAYRPDR